MSLFSKILDKLGLRKEHDQPAQSTPGPVAGPPKPTSQPSGAKPAGAKPSAPAPTGGTGARSTNAAPTSEKGVSTPASTADRRQRDDVAVKDSPAPVPATPEAMSQVDVMQMLEQKARGTGLNWKQSISDLLFLLDLDNSREARNELAKELGCPPELMSDSAKMNTWLHKTVLRKIAENGGNIPKELLD